MKLLGILAFVFNLQVSANQNLDFWFRQLQGDSVDLKINALQKLGEIRDPSSLPYLREAISMSDPKIRYYAAAALGRHTFEESMEILSEALVKEKDVYVSGEIRRNINQLKEYFTQKESKKPPTE